MAPEMIKTKTKYFLLILTLIAINLFSCKVFEINVEGSKKGNNSDEWPKILFISYFIKHEKKQNEIKIQVVEKIITAGQLKSNTNSFVPGADEFILIITDYQSNIITQEYMANPLSRTLEYVDDFGNLAKKDVLLDSTYFSLRVQLNPASRYVILEKHNGPDRENTILSVVDITSENLK
jgi:hypothetical protein